MEKMCGWVHSLGVEVDEDDFVLVQDGFLEGLYIVTYVEGNRPRIGDDDHGRWKPLYEERKKQFNHHLYCYESEMYWSSMGNKKNK